MEADPMFYHPKSDKSPPIDMSTNGESQRKDLTTMDIESLAALEPSSLTRSEALYVRSQLEKELARIQRYQERRKMREIDKAMRSLNLETTVSEHKKESILKKTVSEQTPPKSILKKPQSEISPEAFAKISGELYANPTTTPKGKYVSKSDELLRKKKRADLKRAVHTKRTGWWNGKAGVGDM